MSPQSNPLHHLDERSERRITSAEAGDPHWFHPATLPCAMASVVNNKGAASDAIFILVSRSSLDLSSNSSTPFYTRSKTYLCQFSNSPGGHSKTYFAICRRVDISPLQLPRDFYQQSDRKRAVNSKIEKKYTRRERCRLGTVSIVLGSENDTLITAVGVGSFRTTMYSNDFMYR